MGEFVTLIKSPLLFRPLRLALPDPSYIWPKRNSSDYTRADHLHIDAKQAEMRFRPKLTAVSP